MHTRKIDNEHIDQGIDRKDLNRLKKRFLEINQHRLERTLDALLDRQQLFVELLPLLFHCNHPALPGYVSNETPAGISGFEPDKPILKSCQRITRSFRYQPLNKARRSIHGIYIMGSIGTIGQSSISDLDFWLCHRPGLSESARNDLNDKASKIAAWAGDQGLEVHFFLMDAERFRSGETSPLSTESSGSAQHVLLLDEFYRTAIYLAGRIPLWWFVPARCESDYQDYTNTLLQKRFIRASDIIDFGGTANIPLDEFASAGIWHLYKGIDSPYKSVLKLLLLEVYASEHPNGVTLAQEFKQAIYDDRLDVNLLDPYLMVYKRIESYLLNSSQLRRLDLVRRCFYFKVNKPLTRAITGREKSWQRRVLEDLIHNWKWHNDQLVFIDRRRDWKAPQVMAERQLLVTELLNSYRFLTDFYRDTHQASPQLNKELVILGRKLYAAFERTAGKIEWINPSISPDLGEEALTFKEVDNTEENTRTWKLYAQASDRTPIDPYTQLKSTRHLAELIIWSYCNSILDSRSYCSIEPLHGNTIPLPSLLHALRQWLPLPMAYAKHNYFINKPFPVAILLIVNLYQPPEEHINLSSMERNLHMDAFNYGPDHKNLIDEISLAIHNSWNEVIVHTYEHKGLINILLEYLRLSPNRDHVSLPKLVIHCRESHYQNLIQQRLEHLFRQLASCFYSGLQQGNPRFIFSLGGEFVCAQFINHQPQINVLKDFRHLMDSLAQPQATLNPLILDQETLHHHPLHAITAMPLSDAIQVFFLPRGKQVDIFILDERNTIVSYHQPYLNNRILLRPLHRFIRSILERHSFTGNSDIDSFGVYPVEFYELQEDPQRGYYCQRRPITKEINSLSFFNVQAIADVNDKGEILFSIYCDQQAFTPLEQGDEVFIRVAQYILSHRQDGARYPSYITDLDLSQAHSALPQVDGLQISHYLNIKLQLEAKLNQAIQLV